MFSLRHTRSARLAVFLVAVITATTARGAAPPYRLVAAAPGYPGSSAGAQPTMDRFADRIAHAAGLSPGEVSAEYVPSEQDGVARIADPGTSLALVPLAFFLTYERQLGLEPLAQTVGRDGSPGERWSLVAGAGRVSAAADLAGWELVGVPAYAEPFVRGTLLGEWGLPADTRLVFSGRVLGALRRIAAGEDVAVLLDEEQTGALGSLPNADAYEILFSSEQLPSAFVVGVDDRLSEEEASTLRRALLQLSDDGEDGSLLTTLRLRGFATVDTAALDAARAALRVPQ